jgi:hypothetical protein
MFRCPKVTYKGKPIPVQSLSLSYINHLTVAPTFSFLQTQYINMRISIIASILGLVASQVSAQYYINQTAPFALVVLSSNATLNGTALSACHEGAAIKGLCLSGVFDPSVPPLSYAVYNFNYTTQLTPDPVLGYSGILTWELRGGNFNLSSPLSLPISPTSDVAIPLFTPSEDQEQILGFDKSDLLYIASYIDDTVSPPIYRTKAFYRWYICYTNYSGYFYQTLSWVVGVHTHPQNPSCQKVDVKRVFV